MSVHRYSAAELKAIWIKAGGSRATAPLAAAVALAESGGVPNAINHNTDGSIDRGLWQINSVHGKQSTTDPLANAKAAVKISSGGLHWQPWTTYKNGAYRQFLKGARSSPAAARLPASAATQTQAAAPASSSSDLFGDSKQSQLKYAAVWAGVLGVGVAIAGIGVNRMLGGAPARVGKAVGKTAAKTAAKAAVAA